MSRRADEEEKKNVALKAKEAMRIKLFREFRKSLTKKELADMARSHRLFRARFRLG